MRDAARFVPRVILVGPRSSKLDAVADAAASLGQVVVWADGMTEARVGDVLVAEEALIPPRGVVTVVLSEKPPLESDDWCRWPAERDEIRARLRAAARWAGERREREHLRRSLSAPQPTWKGFASAC